LIAALCASVQLALIGARWPECYILLMPLLATDAIVLHAFDYLESSRIIRLLTREAGVQSVLARGARKSRGRYGTALDLFAEGSAQLYVKPNRELHNLAAFEISRSRGELAADVGRFTAASTVAELALRFGGEEANPDLYETVANALDRIAQSPPEGTIQDGLAACWRVVSVLGFTPELTSCALCHTPLRDADEAAFSHASGGIVCPACSRLAPAGRRIPASARAAIRAWLALEDAPLTEPEARSHQRLLREFLGAHLADDRPLRAFAVWEHERWSAA
jgi:DNA repair protein RecO (recombination protein O)